MGTRPEMADVVTLAVQMRRDADASRKELLRRDRTVLTGFGTDPGTDRGRLLTWVRHVDDGKPRRKLGSAETLAWLLAALLGGLTGAATALAVFRYDGDRPINVLVVLGVFVALQLVLCAFTVLALVGGLPGLGALRALSPGRWLLGVAGWLPGEFGDTAHDLGTAATRGGKLLGGVSRAFVVAWSQVAAVAFNCVAIGVFLFLVTTRDLAFGWSTTLEWQPERMHGLASALAWFWPGLTPDLEAVAATQVYRAEQFRGTVDATVFGVWWRYLLALMVFYGLLPRLILAAVSGGMLRRAARVAFDTWPGTDAVLLRLTSPVVETSGAAGTVDASGTSSGRGPGLSPDEGGPGMDSAAVTVRWAEAPGPASAWSAGGGRTLEDDRALIAQIAAQPEAVVILVKAWEPPVLEFVDFVRELREALGEKRMIDVVAVTQPGDRDGYVEVWRRKLASVGDPWLRVGTADAEGGDA